MSKKKDREDTNYRYCSACGRKQIIVYLSRKLFKYKTYIYCYNCQNDFEIKKVYRKRNLASIEIENLYQRNK